MNKALTPANDVRSLHMYFILCQVLFARAFYFSYLVPLYKGTYLSKISLCECALISSCVSASGTFFSDGCSRCQSLHVFQSVKCIY